LKIFDIGITVLFPIANAAKKDLNELAGTN